MRPLYRNLLIGVLAVIVLGTAAVAWATGRGEPERSPARDVTVGESYDPSDHPPPSPSPSAGATDDGDDDDGDDEILAPPPAVTDDDDDDDD
ncbi:hypothetical protein [Nocardiopsis baichengensis]|uniref:hypothetical protein n=1 Tax=Nocardiopsis baichengensis TaxID=280240 RepID=UPI0003480679|nr:hypothetical protein [Nocardiopsis baichengensis]